MKTTLAWLRIKLVHAEVSFVINGKYFDISGKYEQVDERVKGKQ